jgi:hypothetical protein
LAAGNYRLGVHADYPLLLEERMTRAAR